MARRVRRGGDPASGARPWGASRAVCWVTYTQQRRWTCEGHLDSWEEDGWEAEVSGV